MNFGPKVNKKVYELSIPILGICYGMQLICEQHNGEVRETNIREFGKANIRVLKNDPIFNKTLNFTYN